MLTQQLVDALLIGGVYAAVGVGFSLIYGVMNIINLAHGSLIMMGAYTTYQMFVSFQLNPFLSIPLAMVIWFVIGYALQRFVLNRVIATGVLMSMILTYGVELILLNVALLLWGADYRTINLPYSNASLSWDGLAIPVLHLAAFGAGLALTALLYLYLTRTRMGRAIQATALNREAARMVGVRVDHVYGVTYGLAAALAAAAGSLLAAVYTITPGMENDYLGKAFVIAVLGGLGNVWGAIVGGLVLALAEGLGVATLGPSYQLATGFFIFVLVLVIRPHGLVGKRFYAEL